MSGTFGPKINSEGKARGHGQTGLIAYFDCSNPQSYNGGSSIRDLVGGFSGTVSASGLTNRNGGAIEFDGTDDSISIDFSQLGTLSDMTLEIVAETYGGVALSSQECLIETDDGRDNGFGVFLEYGGKDFAWLDNPSNPSDILIHSHDGSSSSLLSTGPFVLTLTCKSSGVANMYYNGILVNATSGFASRMRVLTAASSKPMIIGQDRNRGNLWRGYFYSLKIYNKIVKPTENRNVKDIKRKVKLTKRKL